jgi:glutaredoxin
MDLSGLEVYAGVYQRRPLLFHLEKPFMLASERVRVFWQPGCTSCLRTKEFLTESGVDYESINVHGNPAGMEELRKLGARSVPVVARGGKFVFAQALGDVIKFLDLKAQLQERLSPDELVKKLELVLPAAARYIRQIPAAWLDKPFRNRSRPIRVLCHHVFRIVEGFLESMQDGGELTYERIMQEAPMLRTGEDIARVGESVLARLQEWWKNYPDRSCSRMMDTYFGKHPVHIVLERTAWHPTQHTRQLMLILETLNIKPDRPLTTADLAGLPLPEKAWDDEKEAA